MSSVTANITTSLDGYITGPNDGPAAGLGEGGERLHYWVFGGPWTYADPARGEATGADREFLETAIERQGAVIAGRGTYEAAEAWGGASPWPVPFFIVTHRPENEPPGAGFTFVGSLDEALRRGRVAAGDRAVNVMGGAETIRQALRAGVVEELSISIAPVTLGAGKRLFDGFHEQLSLEPIRVLQSPLATHITYRVRQ
jgi:dihydrofolate reductase